MHTKPAAANLQINKVLYLNNKTVFLRLKRITMLAHFIQSRCEAHPFLKAAAEARVGKQSPRLDGNYFHYSVIIDLATQCENHVHTRVDSISLMMRVV